MVTADPSPEAEPSAGFSASTLKFPNQTKLPDYFTPSPVGNRSRQGDGSGSPVRQKPARTASPTKRKTKKQLEEEKHERLSNYARQLFDELNASVFANKLPAETILVWNKRLSKTAGRAKWHK